MTTLNRVPILKLFFKNKFQKYQNEITQNWDFIDNASIIFNCDLVITNDTVVAHLAGAMGARVIVLPPLMSYITWETKDLKWYPDNVVVLQQMEYNSWDKTIDKLYEMMENWEW